MRAPALVVAAVLAGLAALGPAASATANGGAAPVTPIRHFVVMTQDQHSFDNYFGTRPGVDGIPPKTCLPTASPAGLPAASPAGRCVAPYPIDTARKLPTLRVNKAVQAEAVDGGRMDGFVRAQAGRNSTGSGAMGYYRPADVAVLGDLARHGELFDHWFSGVPGGSVVNRLFDITARPVRDVSRVPAHGWHDMPVIFDRLTTAGVSWRVYVQNYAPALTISTASTKARIGGQVVRVPLLAMSRYIDDPALARHIVDFNRYYRDLANGTLPAVSFLVASSGSEHPPQRPDSGQRFVRAAANGLITSSAWPTSAFLLQYDSSGGWYDHIPPPILDGAPTGLRVPAILISPYVRPGAVDHATYDAASTLRFIENNWRLAPLARRDRDAADLTRVFRFGRRPARAALIGVADQRPAVRQPNRALLYVGYGLALAGAIAVVGVALRRRPRLTVPLMPATRPCPRAVGSPGRDPGPGPDPS